QSPPYHNALGAALRQQGDLAGARVSLAEAARLNKLKSDRQAALFALNAGLKLLREGKSAAAIERLTAATRLDPTNPDAHRQLGLALRRAGRLREAATSLQQADQLAPRRDQ
ncbi:MAG: tetratricopeptide repeat protein, partial [Acidobacteriota bacterium]